MPCIVPSEVYYLAALFQVSGVVMDPYRGARAEGVGGFFRGVKSGITGAAVKPVVAVLDAATFGFEQVADKIGNLGEHPVKRARGFASCFAVRRGGRPNWPLLVLIFFLRVSFDARPVERRFVLFDCCSHALAGSLH